MERDEGWRERRRVTASVRSKISGLRKPLFIPTSRSRLAKKSRGEPPVQGTHFALSAAVRPATMESRTGNSDSGNAFDELPVNHGTPRRRKLSSAATDFGADTSGEAFDGRSHKRSILESDAGLSLWAGLHPDILGIVLRLLLCLADRASVRSVCRHWCSGAHNHVLPPPLPLLVLPMYKFSSLSSRGELRLLRRVPIPEEVGADRVRFVGSFDGWLVGQGSSESYKHADGECFLLNALSSAVVRLPNLCTSHNDLSGYSCKTLFVTNGIDTINFSVNDQYMMSIRQVVLSASPESGSKYVVAASSFYLAKQKIALWQPGMMSWHVCVGFDIVGLVDLAFYQGKLYVFRRLFPLLYEFELEEDDRGVIVSRVECCMTEPFPPQLSQCSKSCNMVVWRGNLLLIIRSHDKYNRRAVVKVDVFAIDFSTNPKGLIEIHNVDGDCIFVDSGGCKSFPASLHIYFVPDYFNHYDSFVYNMRDDALRPDAVTRRALAAASSQQATMESSTGNSDSGGNMFDELSVSHGTRRRRRRSSTASDTSGEAFDGRSLKRSILEFDAGVSPWAGLHPDILGIVLRCLPCLADRASVRSVCRHWRSGGRIHVLPPPLPLLVSPMFKFASLSSRGSLRILRCVPMPEEVGADRVRFVGSFDGWLVGVAPSKDRIAFCSDADEECFLLNAFSHAVIIPVINALRQLHFRVNDPVMSLHQVILSASPESGSKYVVAASFYNRADQKIALWQPGMMSWNVCVGFDIQGSVDLAFYQGKLYVLRRPFALLYVFELEEDDRGVIVSRVEHCVTQPLQPQPIGHSMSCNMVVWRGNLLLIIRYYDRYTERSVVKVEVFAVDFSTNPKGLIKIDNFEGDCIFVDSGGCKSFPTNLHDGVEGDHIYFVPDYFSHYDSFVYNMRDGRMRPLAVNLHHNVEEDNLDFP
ncbi:hypothetical protein EJB05_51405, partial [Eragrostis curvula]